MDGNWVACNRRAASEREAYLSFAPAASRADISNKGRPQHARMMEDEMRVDMQISSLRLFVCLLVCLSASKLGAGVRASARRR